MPDLRNSKNLTNPSSMSRNQLAQTEIGMAHFAATSGTADKCKHCEFWRKRRDSDRKRYCKKYIQMTGDDKKSISGAAYACKYFEYGPEKKA